MRKRKKPQKWRVLSADYSDVRRWEAGVPRVGPEVFRKCFLYFQKEAKRQNKTDVSGRQKMDEKREPDRLSAVARFQTLEKNEAPRKSPLGRGADCVRRSLRQRLEGGVGSSIHWNRTGSFYPPASLDYVITPRIRGR